MNLKIMMLKSIKSNLMRREIRIYLKTRVIKNTKSNITSTKISRNKEIQTKEKKVYMENQEMFQQNQILIQNKKAIHLPDKKLII